MSMPAPTQLQTGMLPQLTGLWTQRRRYLLPRLPAKRCHLNKSPTRQMHLQEQHLSHMQGARKWGHLLYSELLGKCLDMARLS
jgi:hypothetical protein